MTNFPDLKDLIHGIDDHLEGIVDSDDVNVLGSEVQEPMVKYILVAIGKRHLAITIDSLAEIGPLPQITFLPNLPDWILGIMNIRSEIISMIDFAGFLQEQQIHVRGEKKLVVLRNEKMKVGIGVDSIVGTVTRNLGDIEDSDIESESAMSKLLFSECLFVEEKPYSILNVGKFLTHSKLVNFSEVS